MSDNGEMRRSVFKSLNDYPFYESNQAQLNLEASCKNSLDFVQRLSLVDTLNVHNGCVNTVNWNASGTYIVSGSDDNHLVITEAKTGRMLLKSKTQHKRHIFSARFMPQSNDQAIISCSGEGIVIHTEYISSYSPAKCVDDVFVRESGYIANVFDCHAFGSAYDVLPLPDVPRAFISCGEDGTVRCVDLRISSCCLESVCEKHTYITAPCAVTAMDVTPINHYTLAIGCSDSIVRLYDRRMLMPCAVRQRVTWPIKAYPIPMKYTRRHYRPTCVKFSADETELLVSYSMEQLYLFDLNHPGYNDAELVRSGCYTPKLRRDDDPEPQMPRLRFRGDWSDTGPNSMATADLSSNRFNLGQARPPLEPGVLSRLSDEIFRMLNSQSRQSRNLNAPNGGTVRNTLSTPNTGHLSWQDAVLRTLGNHHEPSSAADNSLTIETPIVEGTANPTDTELAETAGGGAAAPEPDSAASNNLSGIFPLNSFDYVKMSFSGHRNSRTMVKGACFWGDDFIMSGSDCGHIFIWQRQTGKVVKTLLADQRVVNRVQPHPTMPYLISSGIDYNIKMWAPRGGPGTVNVEEIESLIKSNAIMLVETRDTITVPAQIMIRILASLHQYRRLMHAPSDSTAQNTVNGANAADSSSTNQNTEASQQNEAMDVDVDEDEAMGYSTLNDDNNNDSYSDNNLNSSSNADFEG